MQIEKIPSYRMVYFRQTGSYGDGNKQVMEKLKAWSEQRGLLNDEAIIFGIAQDNPQITPGEKCRYDACLVVGEDLDVGDEVAIEQLQGGTYIVKKIPHTKEAVQQAWVNVFAEISKKGYVYTNEPILERYSVKMVADGFCEICVPIVG